jgi:2-oxoglutarate dehydrogenase E2 component (dihydrolipoamide succinyltransferase)
MLPESVADATMLHWHAKIGDPVRRDDNLVDIETEKVVLEVPAPRDGVITKIFHAEGETVLANDVIALFEEGAGTGTTHDTDSPVADPSNEKQPANDTTSPPPPQAKQPPASTAAERTAPTGPAVRHQAAVEDIDLDQISGSGRGGRILKEDLSVSQQVDADSTIPTGPRESRREPMSRLRRTIASRLVQAQQNAAILTTFNEVDLHQVKALRARYRETFEKTHGVRLGFMSFFVKACVEALKRFPILNAAVDGDDIIYHDFYDIGIAVSSPRGLVVPVLRDADQRGLADIESRIAEFGQQAQAGALRLEDLTGGTFTITNGGVFGSMLSTPILNPPQSAILGMHKIQERPMALDGAVVIRPMMYLALSYDHRIIDGSDAVSFLIAIKAALEDPARLLLEV